MLSVIIYYLFLCLILITPISLSISIWNIIHLYPFILTLCILLYRNTSHPGFSTRFSACCFVELSLACPAHQRVSVTASGLYYPALTTGPRRPPRAPGTTGSCAGSLRTARRLPPSFAAAVQDFGSVGRNLIFFLYLIIISYK